MGQKKFFFVLNRKLRKQGEEDIKRALTLYYDELSPKSILLLSFLNIDFYRSYSPSPDIEMGNLIALKIFKVKKRKRKVEINNK